MKFLFLMSYSDGCIVNWLVEFDHLSFQIMDRQNKHIAGEILYA